MCIIMKEMSIHTNLLMCLFFISEKEDENNSGSGDPPKKKPTRLAIGTKTQPLIHFERFCLCQKYDLCVDMALYHPSQLSPPHVSLIVGIEGGFDVEQEQYDEEVKVVLFPDRQEITADDLNSMADVCKDRVSHPSRL